MKKLFLSFAAVLAASSMSAKTVLTEIPAQYNIPESGEVKAWDWLQGETLKTHPEINGTDTTDVIDFDYRKVADDYLVLSLSECTAGYKLIVTKDWTTKPETVFSAGTTLAAINMKELGLDSIVAIVIQPTGNGIMKISEMAYVSAEELAEMKAVDDAKERYMEKKTDWTVNMTDNDASGWNTPGWFDDKNLDALYKNVVIEIGSASAVSRICVQTLPDYAVHEFMVAPTDKPVKVVYPITAEANGIGQIAVTNRNVTKYLVDSITGILQEWTDSMTVVVNKIYYTSNEETSTFTAAEKPEGSWIKFDSTMVCAAGNIAAKYTSPFAGFELAVTDTEGKISIDANTAQFGIAPGTTLDEEGLPIDTISGNANTFKYRLKTGGKSSSKNTLALSIPADGVLTIAVRTATSSATDRKMVVKQGGEELFNDVIVEGMGVSFADGDKKVSSYPMISMRVKQGTVDVTYPSGALNFYAFGYGVDYYVKPAAEEPEPEEPSDPEPEPVAGEEIVIWEGSAVTSNWSAADLLTDGCPELTKKGMAVGDVVRFYITCSGTLNVNIAGGHWEKDADGNAIQLAAAWSQPCTIDHFDMNITEETYKILTTVQYWGSGCKINAGDEVTCTKITLIKASTEGIESVTAASESNITYNLAGQRAAGKGLLIKNGKVVLVK